MTENCFQFTLQLIMQRCERPRNQQRNIEIFDILRLNQVQISGEPTYLFIGHNQKQGQDLVSDQGYLIRCIINYTPENIDVLN